MLDWFDGIAERWDASGRSAWSLSMVVWVILGEFAGAFTYVFSLATGQAVGAPWWVIASTYLLGLPAFFLLLGAVVWWALAKINGV